MKNSIHFRILYGVFFLLLAYQSFSKLDMIWPDEHFQTLEIANRVVNGYGWLSTEWITGMRSYIGPAFFVPVIWVLKLFGIDGGILPIQLCRFWVAILSFIMVWKMNTLLERRNIREENRFIVVALYALIPAMIVWFCTTFTETIAAGILWIVMPFCIDIITSRESSARDWFWCTLLVSLPFLFRPQLALWIGPFVLISWVLYRPALAKVVASIAGGLTMITFYGLVDYFTWGGFFSSILNFWRVNVDEGYANLHGTNPFFEYIPWIGKNLGPHFWIVFVVALAFGQFRKFKKQDLLLVVPSIMFFVIHGMIEHKELRYLLPIYPLFFYLLAINLEEISERFEKMRIAVWNTYRWSAPLILLASILSIRTVDEAHYYAYSDASEFSVEASRLGLLKDKKDCIYHVNHFWLWGRGYMIFGHAVKFYEKSMEEVTPMISILNVCKSAIVRDSDRNQFITKFGPAWKQQVVNRQGHALFVKVD